MKIKIEPSIYYEKPAHMCAWQCEACGGHGNFRLCFDHRTTRSLYHQHLATSATDRPAR